MTALSDWRLAVRLLALVVMVAGLFLRPVTVARPVYDVVAVLDITGSMNVRDQHADGVVISRIAMEKRAMHRLLASLPCGSSLGLAIFVEKHPFLLFVPVEVCENFAPLDEEIETVSWRMGWDSESHIAEGVIASVTMAHEVGADVLFMTDGQETPPLWWAGAPNVARVHGLARGLIVGVGGHDFSPIPRLDALGHEVGVMRPGDVPVEHGGMFMGREHLSAVDEGHLRSLATASGLTYAHLEGEDGLMPALRMAAAPRVMQGLTDIRWVPMSVALVLLVLAMAPTGVLGGRGRAFAMSRALVG